MIIVEIKSHIGVHTIPLMSARKATVLDTNFFGH